ncbi:hypothetical protein HK102_003056 [Quaeritorhiza haematococci]|nr:hypothetical protein HK102_003056 [Quaeritorhiza haematococci]
MSGVGYNLVTHNYLTNLEGRALVERDKIAMHHVAVRSVKQYVHMNTYDPIKGYDIKPSSPRGLVRELLSESAKTAAVLGLRPPHNTPISSLVHIAEETATKKVIDVPTGRSGL